jgi:hypothetical protein
MKARISLLAGVVFLISGFTMSAQEWRFDVDRTSSMVSLGMSPLNEASS